LERTSLLRLVANNKELSSMEAQIDPKDISNGFYPYLRKVGPTDPEFLDVIEWLKSKGAPAATHLVPHWAPAINGPGGPLPTGIVWESLSGTSTELDAAMVFNFPHVALVELKHLFGFGDPNVLEFYPGPRKAVSYLEASPIGEAWPEQGQGAFRPAANDSFAYGDEFTDSTGRFRKERRQWAYLSYPVWLKVA
jgi:hypothetical protein